MGDWIQDRDRFIPTAPPHPLKLAEGSRDNTERERYIEQDFSGGVRKAYSPDQPRDEHGRWTSGGGGSGAVDTWARAVEGLREPDGGFTVDPGSAKPVTSGISVGGYAPSSVTPAAEFLAGQPPKGIRIIKDYLKANAATIKTDPALHLGGWHDPASGNVFLDVVRIFPGDQRAEALAAGVARDQISVADLDAITRGDWNHAIINTGGTGGI